jgi:hypothetical protein
VGSEVPPQDGLVKLTDAAFELGCHVETLRDRVRKGVLSAVRGPHGAYYLSAEELLRLPTPKRGRPPAARSLTAEADERSRATLRAILIAKLFRHDVRLAEQMLEDATIYPPAHRLLSVHRLRSTGLATSEIARRLGISERHARRLAGRDPAKFFEAKLAMRYRASLEHRAVIEERGLVAQLRTRLEAEGVRSHIARYYSRGGWKATYPFRVTPDDTPHTRAWLAEAGLSPRQVQAVIRAGVSAEELNELLLRGIEAASRQSSRFRKGHTTQSSGPASA